VPDLVVRTKNTGFQTSLTKNERLKNIKNAFEFNNHYKIKNKDQKIIIFDDVWTTGATVKEIAKVLKKKGISKVVGLTIAKR
jgi:competence protein ComFC